ncbi:MAG: class I SAM-dependent methyltransferase [Gloeobacteraceae cyanobacterium ES-bin-316]|nr:class I SAM-dependent methyltransferase [Ferruginibacter sp.]
MIHYEGCPFCQSGDIHKKFMVKDYTVSGESFAIYQCNNCTGAFTQDAPSQEGIGAYYASENYISHSDTQEGFINKAYHLVRNKTLLQKKSLLKTVTGKTSGNVLDIGCGTGAFLNTMKKAGWHITGLEPDETARKNAEQLYQINPLPSPEIFRLPQNNYDAITMWHVLEHVHELHEYIAQIKQLLKNDGRFVVAVPNYTSADAAQYQQYWAAYDVPRHLYHFSPTSLKMLMKKHGLEVIATKPMWFDSFYVSMLSEQYRSEQGNVPKAFISGALSNVKALLDKEKCSSVIYVIKKS